MKGHNPCMTQSQPCSYILCDTKTAFTGDKNICGVVVLCHPLFFFTGTRFSNIRGYEELIRHDSAIRVLEWHQVPLRYQI